MSEMTPAVSPGAMGLLRGRRGYRFVSGCRGVTRGRAHVRRARRGACGAARADRLRPRDARRSMRSSIAGCLAAGFLPVLSPPGFIRVVDRRLAVSDRGPRLIGTGRGLCPCWCSCRVGLCRPGFGGRGSTLFLARARSWCPIHAGEEEARSRRAARPIAARPGQRCVARLARSPPSPRPCRGDAGTAGFDRVVTGSRTCPAWRGTEAGRFSRRAFSRLLPGPFPYARERALPIRPPG